MPKLTQKQLETNVYENSLQTCRYISGYVNRQSEILVYCEKHQLEFTTRYENVARSTRKHHICPLCQQENKQKNMVVTTCDYCGEIIAKSPSRIKDFNFCSRECKDKAQRLESGSLFADMRPNHYGQGSSEYRRHAFGEYQHQCAVCGWNEDASILEVHHIDSDRSNGSMDNLIILCPTCHRKLTSKKYILEENRIIKK